MTRSPVHEEAQKCKPCPEEHMEGPSEGQRTPSILGLTVQGLQATEGTQLFPQPWKLARPSQHQAVDRGSRT